jgi:hypothetical protein
MLDFLLSFSQTPSVMMTNSAAQLVTISEANSIEFEAQLQRSALLPVGGDQSSQAAEPAAFGRGVANTVSVLAEPTALIATREHWFRAETHLWRLRRCQRRR